MMPVGLAFALLGLRVNEYGPKVIQVFFGGVPMGMRFTLFGLEHFIISWIAAVPLLLALVVLYRRAPPVVLGAAYGVAFYVVVNSLALPWIFSEPTPWQLGFDVVSPSLIVHMEYGVVVALAARRFLAASRPDGRDRGAG